MKKQLATTAKRILSSAQVSKRKENSRSYGGVETINIAYIKEFENEIQLFNEVGIHIRTMMLGTKLLVSFNGIEVTERTMKMRVEKAKEANAIIMQEKAKVAAIAQQEQEQEQEKKDTNIQGQLDLIFTAERKQNAINKLNSLNSKRSKNYLKNKALQYTGDYHNWNLVYKAITK